jgi:hypothetical protein
MDRATVAGGLCTAETAPVKVKERVVKENRAVGAEDAVAPAARRALRGEVTVSAVHPDHQFDGARLAAHAAGAFDRARHSQRS